MTRLAVDRWTERCPICPRRTEKFRAAGISLSPLTTGIGSQTCRPSSLRSVVLLIAVLAGCADDYGRAMPNTPENSRTMVAPATPPPAALALTFYLSPVVFGDSATAAIRARVENAMAGTGFRLVPAASVPHDVDVVVQATARFERVGHSAYGRHVFVTMALVGAQGVIIDRFTGEYIESLRALDAATSRLVQALSGSGRLAQYATSVSLQRAVQAEAVDEAKRREEAARHQAAGMGPPHDEQAGNQIDRDWQATDVERKQRIDRDWYAIDVERCRVPRSLDACADVRGFLAKYPDGAHAEEAKAALATAAVRMEVLEKDEGAWAAAEVENCKRHVGANACARVEIYLAKYPAGLHANEARALTQAPP